MDREDEAKNSFQTSVPNYVELEPKYDVERMRSELTEFDIRANSSFSAASGRRILALRSIAGDPYRTDSGGPSVPGFQDTVWLDHLPYFREILDSLPGPVRSARLWAAGPGTKDVALRTAKLGPPWGLCRLHLPVMVGGAHAQVVFFDDRHTWRPGTLWFTAAWREYALINTGDSELVHLIIDLYHTEKLSTLFPAAVRAMLGEPPMLHLRPVVPLPQQASYRCHFHLPESFANWEGSSPPLSSQIRRPHRSRRSMLIPASVETAAGVPLLILAGRHFSALEHIGANEFRLRGWSDERTIQLTGRPDTPVLLRLREGTRTYVIELPADKARTESRPAQD
jgi:aspartate beta-hydroxylase